MNDSVTRFAIRTASLILSASENESSGPHTAVITDYFTGLGITSREINTLILAQDLPLLNSLSAGNESLGYLTNEICSEINYNLRLEERIFLMLLVQDCLRDICQGIEAIRFIKRTYMLLGIDVSTIDKFNSFILNDDIDAFDSKHFLVLSPAGVSKTESLEGSWIESNAPRNSRIVKLPEVEKVNDHLLVMFVDQIKSFIVRCIGNSDNNTVSDDGIKCRFMLISPGNEVTLRDDFRLSYIDIKRQFLQLHPKGLVTLVANDVEFRSAGGSREIRRFTASEVSGQLIGILGKEGVGKSTLLRLLAAQIKPDAGNIIINGYDLWKYKFFLKGIIGYVPEEDLLFEELTVYENLSLTARLHFSNLTAREISRKIDNLLDRLDISDLKHEVVGNIFKKHIQPGQRRILNIALELLREPHILIVDNALYGLSMSDAAKVIKILHDYTFGGNLVITTISQPGSNAFSYFDKLWILDEGGRLIYNGVVKEAAAYFHRNLDLVYAEMRESDPSALLDLVTFRLPATDGTGILKRVKDPQAWHELYYMQNGSKPADIAEKSRMPARLLKIPNLEVQLLIFSIRNFKAKFSRVGNLILTFLSGPLIGLGISLLMRLSSGSEYVYAENPNIPLSLFISVIVAITMGLIISADEFTKERNILRKEAYLELSRFSYINSKILYLFPLVALQTLLYTITSNWVLEIHGMTLYYWLVLMSSACFGVVLGLFYSISIRNLDSIYKRFVPLTVSLLIILGGGVIPYDNLNLGKSRYSPILSDLIVSKWGYEALAVSQYTNNRYGRLVFSYDRDVSQSEFLYSELMPLLETTYTTCTTPGISQEEYDLNCQILFNELSRITDDSEIFPFEYLNVIPEIRYNQDVMTELGEYLTYLTFNFRDRYERAVSARDSVTRSLISTLGEDGLEELKREYYNTSLEETVRALNQSRTYDIFNNEVVRRIDPIFNESASRYGRASFFSSVKYINGQFTSTMWYNVSVIWIFTFFVYLLLLSDIVNMIRRFFRREPF